MPVIRTAVISDDRLLREGLVRILSGGTSFSIVGQHDRPTFDAALRAAQPDVLLVDSRMEGALGLCAALRPEGGPAVILLAADEDDDFAGRALDAGARGILVRTAGSADLVKAVRVVSQGEIWARRHVITTRMEHLAVNGLKRPGESSLTQELLSGREREVLLHTATGLSNKELADRLGISEGTVKAHLTRIFQKLGVRGRAELAAAYHGIIPPPSQPLPGRSLRRPA
jgi:DNA-binding NarL/FixJ family response regulator